MKKIVSFVVILMAFAGFARAQKIAYVDTQYILDNLPEFTEAQAQLDELSNMWQKEIEAKFAEVDKMYKDFQAQSLLLPDDMKKKKEQAIVDKDKEAKALQMQRFGKDGDLFKKRQELVKPIQEKIYNAIQDIATNNNYGLILDKAGALTLIYASPKYDISDEILGQLGATPGTRKGKSQQKEPGAGNAPGSKVPSGGGQAPEKK
jgi:outer membrane protein